jgi:hypothetical protein
VWGTPAPGLHLRDGYTYHLHSASSQVPPIVGEMGVEYGKTVPDLIGRNLEDYMRRFVDVVMAPV